MSDGMQEDVGAVLSYEWTLRAQFKEFCWVIWPAIMGLRNKLKDLGAEILLEASARAAASLWISARSSLS